MGSLFGRGRRESEPLTSVQRESGELPSTDYWRGRLRTAIYEATRGKSVQPFISTVDELVGTHLSWWDAHPDVDAVRALDHVIVTLSEAFRMIRRSNFSLLVNTEQLHKELTDYQTEINQAFKILRDQAHDAASFYMLVRKLRTDFLDLPELEHSGTIAAAERVKPEDTLQDVPEWPKIESGETINP